MTCLLARDRRAPRDKFLDTPPTTLRNTAVYRYHGTPSDGMLSYRPSLRGESTTLSRVLMGIRQFYLPRFC